MDLPKLSEPGAQLYITKTPSIDSESYVTPDVVAQYLGTTRRRVLDLTRASLLPGHSLPGSRFRREWRFKLSEIDGAISRMEQSPQPTSRAKRRQL
jgi:hypothetical protein